MKWERYIKHFGNTLNMMTWGKALVWLFELGAELTFFTVKHYFLLFKKKNDRQIMAIQIEIWKIFSWTKWICHFKKNNGIVVVANDDSRFQKKLNFFLIYIHHHKFDSFLKLKDLLKRSVVVFRNMNFWRYMIK